MVTSDQSFSPRRVYSRLVPSVLLAAGLWFLPPPGDLTPQAWRLFAVFVAVILGFVLRPMPMGPVVLIGMVVLMLTGTMETDELLSGYADPTTWLIVAAFLIAGAVLRTGLGRRLALLMVCWLGRTMLGLGYSLCGAELVLGPFIPSNTARGGGLLAPLMNSLATTLDSYPGDNPQRAGSFLALVGSHANLITSAMFLTAMAANPLVSRAAEDVLGIRFDFLTWLAGSLVPGLVAMALMPLVIYRLEPPESLDTKAVRQKARQTLTEMGAWSRGERILGIVLMLLFTLWATTPWHGLGATTVAWLGIVLLLVSGTDDWLHMTGNAGAWDTLIWLGGLLAMAGALKEYGFVGWMADAIQQRVAFLPGVWVAIVLTVIYLYSMYFFSMMTAHIVAFVAAFFTVAAAADSPPQLIVALLAYFSCLCAVLTNYSSGPVIIYFGLGYVPAPKWFAVGFVMSLFHLSIWLTIGMAWWKVLGWW